MVNALVLTMVPGLTDDDEALACWLLLGHKGDRKPEGSTLHGGTGIMDGCEQLANEMALEDLALVLGKVAECCVMPCVTGCTAGEGEGDARPA